MLITKNNYDKVLKEQSRVNELKNTSFLKLLETLKRECLYSEDLSIIMVGNSISSGYSKCDEIKPLFMRNKLYDLTDKIDYYSFARVRHNQDSSILEWYQTNKTHTEINKLLLEDILLKKHVYNPKHWSNETVENYKKIFQKKSIGFKDAVTKSNNNIVFYNGLTGIFTDVFRNYEGLVDIKKILTCFKRDLQYAQTLCELIHIDNPSTQIYFSGIPDVMGLGIAYIYNHRLAVYCQNSPNVTYVPSSTRSILSYVDGQQVFDIHYNNPEYMILLNNFMTKILDNYFPNILISELISNLHNYHLKIEKENAHSTGNVLEVSDIIKNTIEKYRTLFIGQEKKYYIAIRKVINYYNENYLPKFCCTPREEVIKQLEKHL